MDSMLLFNMGCPNGNCGANKFSLSLSSVTAASRNWMKQPGRHVLSYQVLFSLEKSSWISIYRVRDLAGKPPLFELGSVLNRRP
jgi:hypothetical protein